MSDNEIAVGVLLAKLPLFQEMDAATVSHLVGGTTRRALGRGQVLFRQGDPVGKMYVVVHGEIKLTTSALSGAERMSGIVGPGQSFAGPVMFLERKALVEAQASTDALLLYLPRDLVFGEIERNPRFARGIITNLSRRIEDLVREIDRQGAGNGKERLIAYLLRLARGMTDPALAARGDQRKVRRAHAALHTGGLVRRGRRGVAAAIRCASRVRARRAGAAR